MEGGVLGDVRREQGAVRAVEAVALGRLPVRQGSLAAESVDQSGARHVAGTGEDSDHVLGRPVFLCAKQRGYVSPLSDAPFTFLPRAVKNLRIYA